MVFMISADVRDLRGIGIQVSKLDQTGSGKGDEKVKSILDFVSKKPDVRSPPKAGNDRLLHTPINTP
jgi:hypothetical protein